jgi:TfoX/Sxy family transcriptional regulator of competence genes
MSYNENLADKIRELIAASHDNVEEKKMFGGLCFMVNDKMCVGVNINKGRIMVRIDPDKFEEATAKEGCEPMVHNGKVMKGFMFIDTDVITTKKQLEYWVNMALDYNANAKLSKKKK